MYKDEGRLAEIEPLYLRALEIEDRLPGKNEFLFGIMLTDVAYVYCEEGRYEAALPLYQRALYTEEAKWRPDDPKLVSVLDQYADALEKLNRRAEASGLRSRSARPTAAAARPGISSANRPPGTRSLRIGPL